MYIVACILLVLWSLVGSFDASYYHDKKYSLHLYSDSIKEHLYHTVRSVCYPIIIFSLFYKNFTGIVFLVGVLAVIVDTLFFLLDAVEEKKSRNKWGGLSNGEYITHLISNTLHYCAITTVLLAKFFLDTSRGHPYYLSTISIILIIGGSVTAFQHIYRFYKYKYRLFDDVNNH